MRDVSNKPRTLRTALAESVLHAAPATLAAVVERRVPKGDVLEVARVAAIQAAKNTSQIIPFCHPVPVEFVGVEYEIAETTIRIRVSVKAIYRTGVEMEALTAASVGALTMVDMLKPLDDDLRIAETRLIEKKGGSSDFRRRGPGQLSAAVLVLSDSIAAGAKSDASGRLIVERLEDLSVNVERYEIVPDDEAGIVERLTHYADVDGFDLVITTGGTGFSPRDNTPEAMAHVVDREIPGIPEAARAYGQERTPYSMLSRGRAGLRGRTLIVNLPGSRKGVADSLDALLPALLHAFKMIQGFGHEVGEAGEKGRSA